MYPDIGGCLRGSSLLLIRRLVDLHGWASAHEVLVAIDVINPGDAWPEFGLGPNERLQRKDKYYIWLVYTEEKLDFGGEGGTTYFFFHSPQLKRQQSFCLQVFHVCLPKEHHGGPQFAWQFWMDQLWTSPRAPTLRPTDRLNVLYEAQIGYKSD